MPSFHDGPMILDRMKIWWVTIPIKDTYFVFFEKFVGIFEMLTGCKVLLKTLPSSGHGLFNKGSTLFSNISTYLSEFIIPVTGRIFRGSWILKHSSFQDVSLSHHCAWGKCFHQMTSSLARVLALSEKMWFIWKQHKCPIFFRPWWILSYPDKPLLLHKDRRELFFLGLYCFTATSQKPSTNSRIWILIAAASSSFRKSKSKLISLGFYFDFQSKTASSLFGLLCFLLYFPSLRGFADSVFLWSDKMLLKVPKLNSHSLAIFFCVVLLNIYEVKLFYSSS